jgi:hypothetical protein
MRGFARTNRCALRANQNQALSIGAIAAIAALLGATTALSAQPPAPSGKSILKPVKDDKTVTPLQPIDLSYVPAKARSILVLRPAASWQRSNGRQAKQSSLELDLAALLKVDVTPDEIEQQIQGFLSATSGDADSPQDSAFAVVRAGHDLDWRKRIVDSIRKRSGEPSTWVDVGFEGRTYSRLQGGNSPAWQEKRFYFPDARTVVVAGEECLRAVIRQKPGDQTDLARAPGWQSVKCSLMAGAWKGGPDDPIDEISANFMEIVGFMMPLKSEQPFRCFCGLDDSDIFRMVTRVEFRDAAEASQVVREANEALKKSKDDLSPVLRSGKDRQGQPLRVHLRWMVELGLNLQLRSDGSAMEMSSHCEMTLRELSDFGGGRTSAGPDPAKSRTDHRETR